GGFGLGGFLTPTGIGTEVAKGKEVITIDGKDYLLEKPLKADVALIFANKADKNGNLQYAGSENNFNHVMAANAKTTIVEAREIVDVGQMDPNFVHTPGIFVNYLVKGA
ncbi:CoA transferase subunit A, partial [Streptococcus pyogenes]